MENVHFRQEMNKQMQYVSQWLLQCVVCNVQYLVKNKY